MNNKLKEGYVVKVSGQLDADVWKDNNGHHERMKIFSEKIEPYKGSLPDGFDMPR